MEYQNLFSEKKKRKHFSICHLLIFPRETKGLLKFFINISAIAHNCSRKRTEGTYVVYKKKYLILHIALRQC